MCKVNGVPLAARPPLILALDSVYFIDLQYFDQFCRSDMDGHRQRSMSLKVQSTNRCELENWLGIIQRDALVLNPLYCDVGQLVVCL